MRLNRNILVLSSSFLLLGYSAYGQSALTGSVSYADSREMPIGVNIYIPELHKGAVTNDIGAYRIENLPKGTFHIQFSFVGFETVIKSIRIEPGENTLDAVMLPSVIEAHEIVISSAYTSSQDENPVKVEQFSREDIDKTGGTTLMESLTKLPGISQVSSGVSIGKPVIRGLSYNRVLVYSQGMRIENQQWGDEHGLGLNDMGVDRVEIIKGPSSLLYGSDAMGGVMHLIGEKPANAGSITGDYNMKLFSNTRGLSSNLGIKGSGKAFRFIIRGGQESHSDYQTGAGTWASNSRFNSSALKSSVGFNNTWISSTLSHHFMTSRLGLSEEAGGRPAERKPGLPYQLLGTHAISSKNTVFAGNSKIKINLGYLMNNRKEFEDDEHDLVDSAATGHDQDEPEDPALNMQLNTLSYDLKWHLPPLKKTEFILGGQGMLQDNKNRGAEILIPDASIRDIGVSAMVKTDLDDASVQLGLRYDIRQISTFQMNEPEEDGFIPEIDRSFQSINGAIGGTVNLSKQLLLRANLATGFRAPNLAELSSNGVHHGTNRFEIGSAELKNEQNIEFDISSHFHSNHATADIAIFNNYIRNYIFLQPTGIRREGFQVYQYEQQNAVLYGGEFTLDIHPHPIDWLHFETNFEMIFGEKEDESWLPLIPANKMVNSIRAELKDRKFIHSPFLNISYVSVFTQNHVSEEETKTPGYRLLNAGLGCKFKLGKQKANISFTANNILDEAYFDHLSRLKDLGIENMGRNYVLNLTIPFGILR